ncbi:hypothetical protein BU202_04215 [Streptococcus cuniculi]|uniref:Uncharacterized protein n=1 Tax=Streptococcus cuniculi TaxID=1432788 RepID=A0A1Q8E8T0_9STRE|nr:hypothetical protein [Streptococcus cuniculi]OLF48204.1 hypothetical protein BU202_04215 [Streptococcus cuniculi]
MKKERRLLNTMILMAQVITGLSVLYYLGYLFGESLAGVSVLELSWVNLWISIGLASVMFAIRMGGRKR